MSDIGIVHRRHGVGVLNLEGAAIRGFDIVTALAGLLLLGVVIVLVGAAVWLEGGRPLIFSQTRLGRHGRRFRIHKFRKFRPQETTGPKLTMEGDSRLTRVGRFIERTKLDELPQLWNVLVGEMSVVGPRPEVPEFADCYEQGGQRLLDFKPGIFGPAQVAFRNEGALFRGSDVERFYRDVLFPAKARLDLAYYPHRSLAGDVAWICRGVLAVVRPAASVAMRAAEPAHTHEWQE
jgi:lipopolysaccharide/colanic/teichoic acid biosynthesis glycosyltransferase